MAQEVSVISATDAVHGQMAGDGVDALIRFTGERDHWLALPRDKLWNLVRLCISLVGYRTPEAGEAAALSTIPAERIWSSPAPNGDFIIGIEQVGGGMIPFILSREGARAHAEAILRALND